MKPRRWFRFSLSTFFVLLTVFGIALGWICYQVNWVRERENVFKEIVTTAYRSPRTWTTTEPKLWRLVNHVFNCRRGSLYWDRIVLRDESRRADVRRVQWLFPEATVECDPAHKVVPLD